MKRAKDVIRSKNNGTVKAWKKLLTPKGRRQSQTYIVEGDHLVEEAMQWQAAVSELILTEAYLKRKGEDWLDSLPAELPIYYVDEAIAKELSDTPTPQGVFAIVTMNDHLSQQWLKGRRYLLVDAIQDPGNLGTVIRTADAADFDAVILGEGTVDIYNSKVLRATQGSLWHLTTVQMPLEEAIKQLQQRNIAVYATALDSTAVSYRETVSDQAVAIVVGNEGQGVRAEVQAICDQRIYIPMKGNAESLNVGVAAGILLFYYQ